MDTTTEPTAAPAAPAPEPTPAPAPVDQEPAWLAGRLAREREAVTKQILTELGVSDPKDAKAALKAYREAERAKLTEAEQLKQRLAELEPEAKAAAAYRDTLKVYADSELAKLSDAQRAAVTALGGEDPARVLTAIQTLRPTWAAAVPPVAPAATTAPATAAPTPAPASSPTNHRQVYEQLKQSNPVQAALYLERFKRAIYPNT